MGQNIITPDNANGLNQPLFRVSEALGLYRARAKYIRDANGSLRLASVCEFSHPVFNPHQLEQIIPEDVLDFGIDIDPETSSRKELLTERATRRAKTAAFDLVCSNHDLDTFVTLTYSPEHVDRASYEECYGKLKTWLSNRVSRYGFKYVAVPEHHKKGNAIHFHMICNRNGLNLRNSGHKRNGQIVWNVDSWKWGFSTAILIGEDETDRDRVSKYIYKYMGKQVGQKIGGRYYLHGGMLEKPVFLYSDDATEFFDGQEPKYHREKEITRNTRYEEWSFI